ncbi:MAG: PDZ/DHR/GLGF domain-containing protein [Bacteroidetes bacterium]|nr:MAG: PDZ/DHR/GLGF domain-containing protein [Bacteroidota bacterium]
MLTGNFDDTQYYFQAMKKTLLVLALTWIASAAFCQQLQRRVYLGIRMENLTEDSKKIMGLGDLNGVLIREVLPRSTAEAAKFKKGDILLSLDGAGVNSTQSVLSVLAGKNGGQSFSYEIYREKKTIKGKAVFKTFPEEKYADLDVEYTDSKSAIGMQRTIITKPKTAGKKPVVAFIGGIGCYSLDMPMDTGRSEVQLMLRLSRAGFLCARLEKPGMGDNARHCKACNEVSFKEETDGYIAAVQALKARSDVDSNAVFIFGHSMGGVFAPLIAQQTALKGIIAYGTLGSNFIEYIAKTRRTIGEAYNMSPEETDELVKDFCECSGYYFVEKMSTAEAAKKKAVCGEYMGIFDLRSRAYNDELYALNIPGIWKPFTGKALLVWGESDYISAKEDHQIISGAVNYYHKGNAEMILVRSADHAMNTAAGFAESQRGVGPYNPEVGKIILDWLKKQA